MKEQSRKKDKLVYLNKEAVDEEEEEEDKSSLCKNKRKALKSAKPCQIPIVVLISSDQLDQYQC